MKPLSKKNIDSIHYPQPPLKGECDCGGRKDGMHIDSCPKIKHKPELPESWIEEFRKFIYGNHGNGKTRVILEDFEFFHKIDSMISFIAAKIKEERERVLENHRKICVPVNENQVRSSLLSELMEKVEGMKIHVNNKWAKELWENDPEEARRQKEKRETHNQALTDLLSELDKMSK